MDLDMLADKEVDKVADMVSGHGWWLIGPKLFRPEPLYPTSVSSKLCEFIVYIILQLFFLVNNQANYKQLPTQSTKIW